MIFSWVSVPSSVDVAIGTVHIGAACIEVVGAHQTGYSSHAMTSGIDALRATVVNPNSWYVPSSMDRNVFSMSFQGGYYAAAGITTAVAITDLAVAGYRGVSGLSRSGRGVSGISNRNASIIVNTKLNLSTGSVTNGRGLKRFSLTSVEQAEFKAFSIRAKAQGLTEHPMRTGKWGRIVNGKFNEVVRIDVGEMGRPGWRGKTHLHIHEVGDHLPLNTPLAGE